VALRHHAHALRLGRIPPDADAARAGERDALHLADDARRNGFVPRYCRRHAPEPRLLQLHALIRDVINDDRRVGRRNPPHVCDIRCRDLPVVPPIDEDEVALRLWVRGGVRWDRLRAITQDQLNLAAVLQRLERAVELLCGGDGVPVLACMIRDETAE